MQDWQPRSSMTTLQSRAAFMADIRTFFAKRQVMEVETPLLSQGTVTDVHLEGFATEFTHHESEQRRLLYLQTSPEFAMKRLLAAGSGPIYQICKAFRNEASGRLHNPEFTMLEWYRPGFTDHDLIQELDDLLQFLLQTPPATKLSYQQAFQQFLQIDPLTISLEALHQTIAQFSQDEWLQQETDKDHLLQWLFCMHIEPELGKLGNEYIPCFVYDFPATQASLAKLNVTDSRVAHRFELYFQGMELANGFYELQDAEEQVTRFKKDNQQRQALGLETKPVDERFIAALESGLPDCAGVAVGLDRLFMLHQGITHIQQVVSFDVNNC